MSCSFSGGDGIRPVEESFEQILPKDQNFVGKNNMKFMLLGQNGIRMEYLPVSTCHHMLAYVMPQKS